MEYLRAADLQCLHRHGLDRADGGDIGFVGAGGAHHVHHLGHGVHVRQADIALLVGVRVARLVDALERARIRDDAGDLNAARRVAAAVLAAVAVRADRSARVSPNEVPAGVNVTCWRRNGPPPGVRVVLTFARLFATTSMRSRSAVMPDALIAKVSM